MLWFGPHSISSKFEKDLIKKVFSNLYCYAESWRMQSEEWRMGLRVKNEGKCVSRSLPYFQSSSIFEEKNKVVFHLMRLSIDYTQMFTNLGQWGLFLLLLFLFLLLRGKVKSTPSFGLCWEFDNSGCWVTIHSHECHVVQLCHNVVQGAQCAGYA